MTSRRIFGRIAGIVLMLALMSSTDVSAAKGMGDHDAKGKKVTLVGEVLDLHCFMLHPKHGQGEGHAKCAKMCINKGLPIGFLSKGKVYLLLGEGHDSVKGLVAKHAGYTVKLTGVVITHHGVRAIQVKSVKKVKGAKTGKKETSGSEHAGHGEHGH